MNHRAGKAVCKIKTQPQLKKERYSSGFKFNFYCLSKKIVNVIIARIQLNMMRARDGFAPKSDLRRWRLKSTQGVHQWRYLNEADLKLGAQSFAEKYFLGLPTVSFLKRAVIQLDVIFLNPRVGRS